MKCSDCVWCTQVSANEYKVLCRCPQLTDKEDWLVEPSYCKHFLKKKYCKALKEYYNL